MRLIDADALANALFEKRKNYPQWVADTIGNMPTIDAIALLKEQEPVKPRKKKDKEWEIIRWSCGNCGYNVGYPHMAYFCSKCGKPILWEGR